MYSTILKLLYFFTFGLIVHKQLGNANEILISASSVISVIYIFVFLLNLLNKHQKIPLSRLENFLILFVGLYIVYTSLNALYVDKSAITQLLIDNISYITFTLLLLDFKRYEDIRESVFHFVTLLFSACLITALFIFLMGYSKLEISSSSLHFISSQDYYFMFGEKRLSWLMTHKVRFAVFCLLGILFIYYHQNFNRFLKIIFISLGLIDIYLSNSMTVLFSSLILFLFLVNFKTINYYVKWLVFLSFLGGGTFLVYKYLSILIEKRDIFTFGGRRFIWQSAIEFIQSNPWGVVNISEKYGLTTSYYGGVIFNNAHNIFLNEFMKHGIIGGTLFVIIYMLIQLQIFKSNSRMIGVILALFISCMMDVVFSMEMLPIFLYAVPLIFYANDFKSKL
ncbi:O-antigen ligase domain-containing protein [Bacillus cereus]|uniref:O-antigen ligase family protein n=1 Tax=Bacillus cereus TaxID=1396 RepID=UPI0005C8A77D|nr:O-antigen ligase family protein [Bacillus cereus]KIZ30508.1 hypothetical protein SK30_10055 [Bacillus cereus]MCI3147615.1 O-antigen ligase domain-containing protein [Bacillus cereus]